MHGSAKVLSALALSLVAACSRGADSKPGPTPTTSAAPTPAGASGAIAFIEDDYPRALAEAKAKGVPIFVDAWAPWCHTCASLRAFVLHDPALAVASWRFVWLSIDTEKESNAPFLAKYPMQFWPTLWVIDPAIEKPAMKWPGSLTTPELLVLLDDAADAVKQKSTGGEAGMALLRGDQAVAEGKRDDAIKAYREALAAAPAAWPRRARTVDSLVTQLASGDDAACLSLAEAELPRMPPGTNATNVAVMGLGCATKLPTAEPPPGAALADAVEKLAKDRSVAILADDRSGLFDGLNDWLGEHGKAAAPRRTDNAKAWAAFLEGEAKAAPSKKARIVFDAHRQLAYLALGEHDKAIAMLTESERDFPKDYNPPARLAKSYMEMGRLDEAEAAVKRSLTLAYGPRRLRIHHLEAKILQKKGDRAGAKRALAEAVKEGSSMTLTGSYKKTYEAIRKEAEAP
jgi:tetratricopeptide (TPR) repeat protein